MLDLFSDEAPWQEPLADGAVILRRRARDQADTLLGAIHDIAAKNPFAHRITPGGHRMSVAMTNCGDFGWSTDSRGYQYTEQDSTADTIGRRCPRCSANWRSTPHAKRVLPVSILMPA